MKQMFISYSDMTKCWYAYKTFKQTNGGGIIVTGQKWDVTESIEAILKSVAAPSDTGREHPPRGNAIKRGDQFMLSFMKDICLVTAVRKGTLYFQSGGDKYQMPLDVWLNAQIRPVRSND